VSLPGVGRLYKNYVQKIQFLPDAANFNAASYGLPPLQFSPLPRTKEVEKPTATPVPATPTAQPSASVPTAPVPSAVEPWQQVETSSGSEGEGRNWGMILSLLFLAAAVATGVYFWQKKRQNPTADEQPTVVDSTEKPTEDSATIPEKAPETVQEALNKAAAESADQKMKEAREKLKSRECILIVATLQDPVNASRLKNILADAGHDVYFLQKNGYRVGIRFQYEEASDIAEKKAELAKITGEPNPFVLKK
jgi:hypothetical protein